MAESVKRRPFQGVWTIIRFNWHLHAIALCAIPILVAGAIYLTGIMALACALLAVCVAMSVLLSLLATWHAYDTSGLYQLSWLAPVFGNTSRSANIHAGFDETSALLKTEFPGIDWLVFDFYDPAKHTEISIRRARKAQPPSPETQAIRTDHIPLADASLDRALLILAAHEIRDHEERVVFFRELKRVLAPDGRSLYVVNYESQTVSKVRTRDMMVIQRLATAGVHPVGIDYDAASRTVWVACYRGTIERFKDR